MNKWIISGALLLLMGCASLIADVIRDAVDQGRAEYQEQCLGFWGQTARFFGLWPQECVNATDNLAKGEMWANLFYYIEVALRVIGAISLVKGLWEKCRVFFRKKSGKD